MKGVFIGRFQPFHRGHLWVIESVHHRFDRFIIGIGSSQYHHTFSNPFTFDERKMMIQLVLDPHKISYECVAIPDIHDPPHWVEHVRSILGSIDAVVTNNPETQALFAKEDILVISPGLYADHQYSGKAIRTRIKENKPWKHLVPSPVAAYIESISGSTRIKKVSIN